MRSPHRLLAGTAFGLSALVALAGCAPAAGTGGGGGADDVIKIGVLSTATGNLSFGAGEAKAAIDAALSLYPAYGSFDKPGKIAGKQIKFYFEGTDGTSAVAQQKVKKLVEDDGVDIVFGPASGDEGETVVQYAKTQPDVTFVNGSASPVSMTLAGDKNFFRFHGDSAAWMGGVGTYAVDKLHYKSIYLLAEDYSFPYDNAGGFFSEFCQKGGSIAGASWVPVGTTDYSTVISKIPKSVDAVYVGLGGADAANFLSQLLQTGLKKPLVGGSIAVDTTALSGKANIADAAVGTITGGPVPGAGYDNPKYQPFIDAYKKSTYAKFPAPSIFAVLYYNDFESLVLGLEAAKGDVSGDHAKLNDALSKLRWDSPTGPVSLDGNRNGIVDNFVIQVKKGSDGKLAADTISTATAVKEGTKSYSRFSSCAEVNK